MIAGKMAVATAETPERTAKISATICRERRSVLKSNTWLSSRFSVRALPRREAVLSRVRNLFRFDAQCLDEGAIHQNDCAAE
jgi:hypothetical protein